MLWSSSWRQIMIVVLDVKILHVRNRRPCIIWEIEIIVSNSQFSINCLHCVDFGLWLLYPYLKIVFFKDWNAASLRMISLRSVKSKWSFMVNLEDFETLAWNQLKGNASRALCHLCKGRSAEDWEDLRFTTSVYWSRFLKFCAHIVSKICKSYWVS